MASLVPALIATGFLMMTALGGCSGRAPLPPAEHDAAVIERDKRAFVEALKPRNPGRPVVAVLALNEGTETTDLLLPHAVLQQADVADVRVVAPDRGIVSLYPALQVEVAEDLDGFDRAFPSGADYVIVPAMDPDDDPTVTDWLRRQHELGALIIAVCSGARVAGNAGLLDGRRFAGHWYDRSTLLGRHHGAAYVPHRRYVIDRGVVTTTGITASIPTSLALVEAIGGRETAQALASELGVDTWGPWHDSTPFRLDVRRRMAYLLNKAAFWRDEDWRVEVRDGDDDVALALAVDAWSRTGHVRVKASAEGPVRLRSGLVLVAEPAAKERPRVPLAPSLAPVAQLDRTLCEIARRFGESRQAWVMLEMEYARTSSGDSGPWCKITE